MSTNTIASRKEQFNKTTLIKTKESKKPSLSTIEVMKAFQDQKINEKSHADISIEDQYLKI